MTPYFEIHIFSFAFFKDKKLKCSWEILKYIKNITHSMILTKCNQMKKVALIFSSTNATEKVNNHSDKV